jgi:hypothetical protein
MTDTFVCGHPRTPENTYQNSIFRCCRTCRNAEISDTARRKRALRDEIDPGWRERKAAAELFRKRAYNQSERAK